MENTLYPLKFKPIYKKLIWGGEKLRESYGKRDAPEKTGESWEISGVEDNVSVVSNGFLKENTLEELIEIYMGDLIGDKVYDQFGLRFPILIKFINSNDYLSIQVHPDDAYAAEHHGGKGKTEMWYILDAGKDAQLNVGFNKDISKDLFVAKMRDNSIKEILNFEKVAKGDVFFIPAGRIHAIGPGIVLAEIQQTSDLTYRIYDWDRKDADGNSRELHLDHALNVLNFKRDKEYRTQYDRTLNSSVNLADCPYFTTQIIQLDQPVDKDYSLIDSFVIYMCIEGDVDIYYPGDEEITLTKGETILIPAALKEIALLPKESSTMLEVFLK